MSASEDDTTDDPAGVRRPARGPGGSSPGAMLRNAGAAWAGEIVAKAASLVFFAVIARELGEGGLGDIIFALSLSGLLVLGAGLGTDSLLEREVARDHRRARSFVRSVTRLKVITGGALLVLAAGVLHVAGDGAGSWLAFTLVSGSVLLEHLGKTRHAAFMAYERMKYMSLSIIVQRTLTALVGVVLLLRGGGVVAASAVFLFGAVVGLAMAERSFRRMTEATPTTTDDELSWRRLLRAGLPIGVSSLLFTTLLRLDAVLVGLLVGGTDNAEVAHFGAAYRVVEATMFLSWYFAAAIMPWISRADGGPGGDVRRGYEMALKAVTALLLPPAIVFAVLAEPIVTLLYGEAYGQAVLPLRFLSAMTVLYGVNYLASTFFVARDQPSAFGRMLVVVVVQNVAFNVVVIPVHGAAGAAFNAVLSGVLLAVLGFRKARQVLGPVRSGRSIASPLLAGGAMAAVMWATASVPLASIAAGVATYAAVLAGAERFLFPEDLVVWRRLVVRLRPTGAAAG